MPMGLFVTCYIDDPFAVSPISIYPRARLGARGNISTHAVTADDNPAGAPRTDAKVEERLAGPFYRRFRRRQRDREKAERLFSVRATRLEQLEGWVVGGGKGALICHPFERDGPRNRHLSTERSGRMSRSAGSSSGTHLS